MQKSRYQSWGKLCLSICMLTGRRIYEVCVIGKFEVVDNYMMRMTGIAKQKSEDTDKSIRFKTFTNSNLIAQAIQTLRTIKDFDKYGRNYEQFRRSTSSNLSSMLKSGTSMIQHKAIKIELKPKTMRQIYVAMLKYEIKQNAPNESDNYYDAEIAKQLGHDAVRDIETVQSYKDIVVYSG